MYSTVNGSEKLLKRRGGYVFLHACAIPSLEVGEIECVSAVYNLFCCTQVEAGQKAYRL